MNALHTHELTSTSTLRRSSRNHLFYCAVYKPAAKHKPSRHAQAIRHWRPAEERNRVFQVTLVSCVVQVQRVFQQVLQADKCQMGGERSARLIDRRRHVLISSMISSFASSAVDHSLGWSPHCQSGPAYVIHVTLWQVACISLVAVFQFLQACLVVFPSVLQLVLRCLEYCYDTHAVSVFRPSYFIPLQHEPFPVHAFTFTVDCVT